MVGFRDRDIKEYGLVIPSEQDKKADVYKIINTGIERAEAESALNNIKIIRARIEKLETSIKEANIVSPINGVVAVRNIEAGEMVKESTDMFVIMSVDQIYVAINVSEKQLAKIKKGQPADFTSDGTGAEIFKGRVDFISPILDTETRSLEMKILAENKNGLLKPGMFAKVSIVTDKIIDALFIPKSTSVTENNANYVFIVKNGTAFKQKIETGIASGDIIEITSGLKQGDNIAGGNVKFLTDGVKVNAVK
jgi:RND family efflux transporter MFP subunit